MIINEAVSFTDVKQIRERQEEEQPTVLKQAIADYLNQPQSLEPNINMKQSLSDKPAWICFEETNKQSKL